MNDREIQLIKSIKLPSLIDLRNKLIPLIKRLSFEKKTQYFFVRQIFPKGNMITQFPKALLLLIFQVHVILQVSSFPLFRLILSKLFTLFFITYAMPYSSRNYVYVDCLIKVPLTKLNYSSEETWGGGWSQEIKHLPNSNKLKVEYFRVSF